MTMMSVPVHSFQQAVRRTSQGTIPKGWYWIAAAFTSIGLWWAMIEAIKMI